MPSDSVNREGSISIYLLVMIVLGALIGTFVGMFLAGMQDRRALAVASALITTAVVAAIRRALGASAPSLFLSATNVRLPPGVWAGILFATIVGGLAAHDLTGFVGLTEGWVIGLVAAPLAWPSA